jgi:hypothetical protein
MLSISMSLQRRLGVTLANDVSFRAGYRHSRRFSYVTRR